MKDFIYFFEFFMALISARQSNVLDNRCYHTWKKRTKWKNYFL